MMCGTTLPDSALAPGIWEGRKAHRSSAVFCEGSGFIQRVGMSAGFAGEGDGLCACGDLGARLA